MVVLPVKCSSLFSRCSVAQAREEPSLIGGRVPMCLHLCILSLVMCPGFGMECVENHDTTDSHTFPADVCSFRDLIGDCSMVAMPPVCTQAYFQATWRLPPLFSDFDQVRRLLSHRLRGAQEQVSESLFRVRPIFSQKFASKSISTQQCCAHNVACQKL